MSDSKIKKSNYLNPYIGGVLLGIVLIVANFVSGRGLGASGAIKSTIVATVDAVAPEHSKNAQFYVEQQKKLESQEYYEEGDSPLKSWLVFEMLGLLVGGFLSGAFAGRLKIKTEHSPRISSKRRLVFALIGGILFGFGSQMGRGCTSGSALSGMAVLSVGGIITMAAIFGTAFAFAYFFRKNWIQ